MLPRTNEDFDDYARRRERKAEIDLRARRDAEIMLMHEAPQVFRGLPWWHKVAAAVVVAFFAIIFGAFIIAGFSVSSVFSGGQPGAVDKTSDDVAGQLKEDLDLANQIICDEAKRLGVPSRTIT